MPKPRHPSDDPSRRAAGVWLIMPSVLLVCSANQCRSPLAEAMLRKALAEAAPRETWRVESAGTYAGVGLPATEYSRKEAQRHGLDLSRHRSRPASCELLSEFDLVLAMEREHLHELQKACPQFAEKVHLLSEAVDAEFDIEDPFGGPPAGYRSLGEMLAGLMADGLPRIRELARDDSAGTTS
jgi:protein-tyrosine-phosphatase